jgi:hypothetical protein
MESRDPSTEVTTQEEDVAVIQGTQRNWMRGTFSFALSLVVGLGLSTNALAYSEQKVTAYKATSAITIDGDLGEWNTTAPAVINQDVQVIRDKGQWTGTEDNSAEIYLMWDEENLYLAAKVMDDTPFMYREGFPPDLADSLVLFLSTNPDADPNRTEYEATDFRLTMVIDDYYFNTGIDRDMIADNKGYDTKGSDGDQQVLDGYECIDKEIEGGYIFESKIPLSNFANAQLPVLVPQAGMTVGLELSMFDLDFPCPGVATARIGWSANADIDTNPSQWGSVTFAE